VGELAVILTQTDNCQNFNTKNNK